MTEIAVMIGQMDEVSASIATAVEQQTVTTREIAASVQLRVQVDRFLGQVRADASERRASKRVDGGTMTATLRLPGKDAIQVAINDLSEGGISLSCDLPVVAGVEASVELQDAGGAVTGKVLRIQNGVLAIEFRNDAATRSRVALAIRAQSQIKRAA